MAQQPFTPAGVQQKQTELYALTNGQLLDEATLIQEDLQQWVKTNFTLDTSQTAYLDGIDDKWIRATASQTAIAVENRLGIMLIIIGTPGASKFIHTDGNFTSTDGPAGFSTSGSLEIKVSYSS